MSSITLRKYVPLGITALTALTIIVEYYFSSKAEPGATIKYYADTWRATSSIINLFAVAVAILVLSRANLYKGRHAANTIDKFLAYEMITFLVVGLAVGLILGYRSETFQSYVAYTLTAASIASIGTYALWCFYAGYKALRIRTLESALLMIGALTISAGQSGWGINYVPGLRDAAFWIQLQILAPVSKAIIIGGGIGGASAAIRTLAGKESIYMKERSG